MIRGVVMRTGTDGWMVTGRATGAEVDHDIGQTSLAQSHSDWLEGRSRELYVEQRW